MRKNLFSLFAIAAVISLASCGGGGGFEGDVRKRANYECQMKKLEAKDQSDAKVQKEVEDLQKEIDAFDEKMEKKYEKQKDDEKMSAKAGKIYMEVMEKCK